ncbi:MAG: MlaD family protein [Gallionella sp.]|nr:MlaD family protein [Gallionella sp.]
MENRPYALIAGLFAALLGIGLLTAFWWLSNSHTPENSYRMISMKTVSGLNKRAAVRFRGVDVGHVDDISLDANNPQAIIVEISVDKRLQLTKGSYGHLAGQGLTGLSHIELDDSGADKTPLGDQPMVLNESEMSSMLASGKKTVAQVQEIVINADKLLKNLNEVLDDKGRQRIDRLLENLGNASAELQPLLKSSTATMDAARPSLVKLNATLDEARLGFAKLNATMDEARPGFAKINTTLDEIGKIGVTVNEETLPRLHQLTHQLNQDAVSLNRLINTMDEHPESVLFGKPAPRPGPAEAGFKP